MKDDALTPITVPPPSAVDFVSQQALDDLAKEGWLYRFDEELVVAGEAQDPLTGQERVYFLHVSGELRRDPMLLEKVVGAAQRRWPQAEQTLLRVPVGEEPPGGFELLAHYLLRQGMDTGPAEPPKPYTIRTASEGDWPFVQLLLAKALVSGYVDSGYAKEVSLDQALEFTQEAYPEFSPQGPFCALIALHGEEPVAHVTWATDEQDQLTGRDLCELIDVYVLPGHQDGGLSRLLSREVERRAAIAGRPLLGRVSAMPDGRHATIATHLKAAGWVPDHDLYWMPLAPR